MSADILTSETFPHGTPRGFNEGCHGSQCPAPLPCRDVHRRYSGDWQFRKQIDAGATVAEILAAETEQARLALEEARAAKRKPKPKRVTYPRRPTTGITTDLQALIAHHHSYGLTDRQIADLIGKTREQVQSTRKHIGLPVNVGKSTDERIRELHAEGLNDITIGARIGRASDYVSTRRRRLGLDRNITHYVKVTDAQLQAAHVEGLTDREMSERFGADRRTVAKRRRALNLPIHKETR